LIHVDDVGTSISKWAAVSSHRGPKSPNQKLGRLGKLGFPSLLGFE
jgi:hypothetical protein